MQSEELWMDLRTLHRHGWSISALARKFNLNRRTVRREVAGERPRRYPQRAAQYPLSAAQLAHLERRLVVCPLVRGTDLHRELAQEYGYRGSYPTLQRTLRALRAAQPKEVVVRFETAPGVQLQVDWKHLGSWPVGEEMVELHALVAILGHSRMPAVRVARQCIQPVTFERLVRCLEDLGGVTREILTDRDPVFCNNSGRGALLLPEWVELCRLLGTVPRACRPHRAQTKGKVERINREVEESLRPWLKGQALPPRPELADYDQLAQRWIGEVILPRRHRTTGLVIGEAWAAERPLLVPVPPAIAAQVTGRLTPHPALELVDAVAGHRDGDHVEVRHLDAYQVAM